MEWSNKDIAQTFYTKIEYRPDLHQCHLCGDTIKQKAATGYTNLINHLKARHPRYREELEVADGIMTTKRNDIMSSGVFVAPGTEESAVNPDPSVSSVHVDSNRILNGASQCQSLVDYYFDKFDEDHYRCRQSHCRRVYAQRRGTGFTNLRYHLRNCIGRDFEEKFIHQGSQMSKEDPALNQKSMENVCDLALDNCGDENSRLHQDDEVILSEYMQNKEKFSFVQVEKQIQENITEAIGDAPHKLLSSGENDQKELVQHEKVAELQTNTARFEERSSVARTKRKSVVVERSQSSSSCDEVGRNTGERSKTPMGYKRTNRKKTNELVDIHQAMIHKIVDAHERSMMKFLQFEREEREKDRLAHMQIMTTMIKAFVRPHD
uniref:AlNc14C181G8232 protein n=1 Tax=Albugo laibachii Nc14 TaxID=890382 RepID=F0WP84_9STRA|nr:AlNc14C181G8232 [Albugo laibachii Nc14]|eukprot:CCA23130.1 AlNc14C181G8232 [Albugo laibachii Nc14]